MVTVDLNSPVPIEDQLRDQIQGAIAQGLVKRGDKLPSVRQLAGDLGIHWNTVARAYRRLRDDGLLAVGRGRAVTVRSDKMSAGEEGEVEKLLDSVFTRGKLSGLTFDEMRATVEARLKAWGEIWEART